MRSLKVLSVLLCYPDTEMYQALPEIKSVLQHDDLLPEPHRVAVQQLLAEFQQTDLISLQEVYVSLFDRGRQLSLHIFEHIHGESRDRGQAMVDLMTMYHQHGFELNAHELPDYLPLFLEFLAQCPKTEAIELLGHTVPILHSLARRLEAKQSRYALLFDALSAIAGHERDDIQQVAKAESETDETIINMDSIWQEEVVTFMANKPCQTATEQPLVFSRTNVH
jgi:nitrate reductase molybdenum cofactor assembly chaperone NarJ/NarW